MNLPFNALQKGIYDRVTADMPTTPIYCPFAPADAALPFIALSGMTATDASAKGMTMFAVTCALDVISASDRSFEELNGILNSLQVALTRSDLTLADEWQEVQARVLSAGVASEFNESGASQHGTLQLRFDLVHVP